MMKPFLTSAVVAFAFAIPTTLFASGSVKSEESTDFYGNPPSSSSESTAMSFSQSSYAPAEEEDEDDQFATEEEIEEQDTRRQEESSGRLRDWSSSVSIGLRASAGTVTFTGDGADNWNYGLIFGAGAILQVGVSEMFSVVPELGLSYRMLSSEEDQLGNTISLDLSTLTIDIPILVRCTFGNGLFVALGPQVTFIASSTDKQTIDWTNGNKDTYDDTVTPAFVEAGLAAGIGWKFDRDMAVDFRFFNSFTDFVDKSSGSSNAVDVSSMFLQLGFTYMLR